MPISFIGSILDSDIAIYAINNTGGTYDFGFIIGLFVWAIIFMSMGAVAGEAETPGEELG